jgi:hypothetical protein
MKIFSIKFEVDKYQILVPVNPDDFDGHNLWIDGSMKLSSWNPPKMQWSEKESSITTPDIAYISPGFYAFNEKAVAVLGELLTNNGELLELSVGGEQLMAFNPTILQNCLDQNRTEWKTRRNGERGRLLKPVINTDNYDGAEIFLIPETKSSTFYVSDKFVERVITNELSGLEFINLESS